jgi:RNA polymerase sigma factor (sigma-70 family)
MKLTEQQRQMIEDMYSFAVNLAHKDMRSTTHWDDIRSIAHEVLVDVVVNYKEDKGCRSIHTFYKHCLVRRISRKYKRGKKHILPRIDNENIIENRHVVDNDLPEYLSRASFGLTDKQKEVIQYIYFDGLNLQEIACKMKCSDTTIAKIRDQAFTQMRGVMI